MTHVQSIETAKGLPTALTGINRRFCRVQSLVSPAHSRKDCQARVGEKTAYHVLAIMLPSKALIAPWPLALVRTLFCVRPQVT